MRVNHKWFRTALAVVISALLALTLFRTAGAAPPGSPFTGVWQSTDTDLSHQTLAIGGVATYHVRLYDDGASVCGQDAYGVPLYAAIGLGTGSASGNTLVVTLAITCLSHPSRFYGNVPVAYTYNPSTDTLTDQIGVVWTRR